MRWGKGPKQRLRFSKSGDPKVEEAYANGRELLKELAAQLDSNIAQTREELKRALNTGTP